jgi:hypothetical protein
MAKGTAYQKHGMCLRLCVVLTAVLLMQNLQGASRAVASSNVLSMNGAKLCTETLRRSDEPMGGKAASHFPSVGHARAELVRCYRKRLLRKQKMHRG